MKKIFTNIFILFITVSTFAQSGDDSSYYYMKCGTKLGKKSELIELCVSGIPKEYEDAFLHEAKVCACLIRTIARNYTYEELESLVMLYGTDFFEIINEYGDLSVLSDLENCITFYIDQDYDFTKVNKSFDERFMLLCMGELKNNPEYKEFDIDKFTYCYCVKEEVQKRGISLSQLVELEDENSVYFNEVIGSCLGKYANLKEEEFLTNDVMGHSQYGSVNLINYGGAYKVNIKIGNLSKYFILDTGASDILISNEFERELLLEGLILRDNYIKDDNYSLADGSIVKCRRVLLDSFEIGGFIVNNVVVAIIDNSGSSLLLGKSFLDKFANWTINNNSSTLYLEKR